MKKRIAIQGAGGRDFHLFNMLFRENPEYEVVFFTAASQIPGLPPRKYPAILAGSLYPQGIPIFAEECLAGLVTEKKINEVYFAYSDTSLASLNRKRNLVEEAGAKFIVPDLELFKKTMIKSSKPVISICAVRTGCGKSKMTALVYKTLLEQGLKAAIVRHPMPYSPQIEIQACQKFSAMEDFDRFGSSLEEREDIEHHVKAGRVCWCGIDYQKIVAEIENDPEFDLIIWDGGNNDVSFLKSDLYITLADPERPDHELLYFPSMINFALADIIFIGKCVPENKAGRMKIIANAKNFNPGARIICSIYEVVAEHPEFIRGKKVLVIEDGPTLTHGEMKFGMGWIAAQKYGAAEIVDPKLSAIGEIQEILEKYPHLAENKILPAIGYTSRQMEELTSTINNSPAETVIMATPADLAKLIAINKPVTGVDFSFDETATVEIKIIILSKKFLA